MKVLYHANCRDGFCAAWLAYKVYGNEATYYPVQYSGEVPNVEGEDVLILDFCYKPEILNSMKAKTLFIIDHHKSAEEYLKDYPTKLFDTTKSGAKLTQEYLRRKINILSNYTDPAVIKILESCHLVDYVQDRDLWKWKLPASKEFNAALESYPMDFKVWDGLLEKPIEEMVNEGRAILRFKENHVNTLCSFANEIEMDGHKVLTVNTSLFQSEVAGQLAKGRPFGTCWFIRQDGKKVWSLRSEELDVSEIAKKHGGGGHRNAAGFEE